MVVEGTSFSTCFFFFLLIFFHFVIGSFFEIVCSNNAVAHVWCKSRSHSFLENRQKILISSACVLEVTDRDDKTFFLSYSPAFQSLVRFKRQKRRLILCISFLFLSFSPSPLRRLSDSFDLLSPSWIHFSHNLSWAFYQDSSRDSHLSKIKYRTRNIWRTMNIYTTTK